MTWRRGKTQNFGAAYVILVWLSVAVGWIAGCADESKHFGERLRSVTVRTVVDQGLTLDQQADPRRVVFVFLAAVKDDVRAEGDLSMREAALDRQLAVCAPDYIFKHALRATMGRDRSVQEIVKRWAPALAYYVESFPTDPEEIDKRLVAETLPSVVKEGESVERTRTSLELADPSGAPEASVVAQFLLVREHGFWRVASVGYQKSRRHLPAAPETEAARPAEPVTK